jgi:hypothetical protein
MAGATEQCISCRDGVALDLRVAYLTTVESDQIFSGTADFSLLYDAVVRQIADIEEGSIFDQHNTRLVDDLSKGLLSEAARSVRPGDKAGFRRMTRLISRLDKLQCEGCSRNNFDVRKGTKPDDTHVLVRYGHCFQWIWSIFRFCECYCHMYYKDAFVTASTALNSSVQTKCRLFLTSTSNPVPSGLPLGTKISGYIKTPSPENDVSVSDIYLEFYNNVFRDNIDKETYLSIPYILFHELICHSYQQCLNKTKGLRNRHDFCGFTDGWMDSIALDALRKVSANVKPFSYPLYCSLAYLSLASMKFAEARSRSSPGADARRTGQIGRILDGKKAYRAFAAMIGEALRYRANGSGQPQSGEDMVVRFSLIFNMVASSKQAIDLVEGILKLLDRKKHTNIAQLSYLELLGTVENFNSRCDADDFLRQLNSI